jgi:CMP/dCMP kinase
VDVQDARAVAALCRRWKTTLKVVDQHVQLWVGDYYPEKEIRTAEVSAAVTQVAAIPKVRDWMKQKQRECIQFGNLVMEGRDIGTNVFPETDFKFYLDAHLEERARRRAAEGVNENLAARDQRDSQRAAAPLMIALGAKVINNSQMTSGQTSSLIIEEVKKRLAQNAQEIHR